MDRDVVVATINYRLGVLGFLATGTKEAVGNMGLKDQVLALKWIQENIREFGGDPNLVTIAGYSAGSFAVAALLASEMTKGLFHRAIANSGSISWQFELDSNQLETARKVAERLECPVQVDEMVECLKSVRKKKS
jgi:carboxylesterase type B